MFPICTAMSLVGKVCWVIGGSGVIGRGICRGLLQAGATVIIHSRSEERLARLSEDLDHPANLVTVRGSLLDETANNLVTQSLGLVGHELNHVVAHGSVRWWAQKYADETNRSSSKREPLLDMSQNDFMVQSSQLSTLHFASAQHLVPRLRAASTSQPTYTFVTGYHGPKSARGQSLQYYNAECIGTFAKALQVQLDQEKSRPVQVSSLRVGLAFGRDDEERSKYPRAKPLSHDIGLITAGMAALSDTSTKSAPAALSGEKEEEEYREIFIRSPEDVQTLLGEYPVESHVDLPVLSYHQGRSGSPKIFG